MACEWTQGGRKQIAARDRRTFRRLGLCSGSPADSPNQFHLQSNCCTAADHHNVKCLDLTPIFTPQSLNPTNTSRGPVSASAFSACQRKSVGARFYIGASVFKLFAAGTSAAKTSSAGIAPPALKPKTAVSVKGVKVSLLSSVRWPRK